MVIIYSHLLKSNISGPAKAHWTNDRTQKDRKMKLTITILAFASHASKKFPISKFIHVSFSKLNFDRFFVRIFDRFLKLLN